MPAFINYVYVAATHRQRRVGLRAAVVVIEDMLNRESQVGFGGPFSEGGKKLVRRLGGESIDRARWSGAGIYSFFNTTTTIVRSTISGNTSGDVGGGIRSLGNMTITNSTISGNASTGWHGGAIFHTDGTMEIESSTIANNRGPDWAPSAIFTAPSAAPRPR